MQPELVGGMLLLLRGGRGCVLAWSVVVEAQV